MRKANSAKTPQVGIFFFAQERLWVECTPLPQAEDYGACKTHSRSHDEYWSNLVSAGEVPDDEYEEHPRGRVVYDSSVRRFTLFADRCILVSKVLVQSVIRKLNLPTNTVLKADSH